MPVLKEEEEKKFIYIFKKKAPQFIGGAYPHRNHCVDLLCNARM
jgi:hypothetical protein